MSKFAMLRKQVSFAVRGSDLHREGIPEEGEATIDGKRERSMRQARSFDSDVVIRKKSSKRRHRTSLGVLEDIIKCPICKQKMQLPRMLPCQHTFCKKCLESTLDENLTDDKENTIRCPVCKTESKNAAPENLPTNLSIETFLKAVDGGSFVEARPKSLHVNFAPLTAEARLKSTRCSKCETAGEPVELCQHCNQLFCRVCEAQHASKLKEQLDKIIDQLQATSNKLDHRVLEFKEKTDNLKNTITKEFDAKMAALNEEKLKKLSAVDEFRAKGESSAAELKRRIAASHAELIVESENFDGLDDDKEKIKKFLKLHRNATEMMSSALNWQIRTDDMVETKTVDVVKIREKEHVKASHKPKQVCDRPELQRPAGITIDPNRGDIYIACESSNMILVFDSQYRLMRKITCPDMRAPHGVAFVQSLQEIVVTDKWSHKILTFGRKGALVRQFAGKGKAEGELRCPEGIAVMQSRSWIYVADTGNDRIQIFGADGAYKGGIGPPKRRSANAASEAVVRRSSVNAGEGVHNFNQPTDVAVSRTAIIVADCGNNKVKVFNNKCQLMFSIGGIGTFKGLFKSPEVVTLDERENIIVGDSDNGRIQVFSPTGSYLKAYGVQGSLVGHFGATSGIVVLNNSEILVADGKKNICELISYV